MTKSYSEMTTAERRSHGAKRAAKTRAETKLVDAYCEKFPGEIALRLTSDVLRRVKLSLETGVDHLLEERREVARNIAEHDRKQAEFLAKPITPEMVEHYTGLIKNRQLYEGACDLSWVRYFEHLDAHPEIKLTDDDRAYAAQWTSLCAVTR